jgi:hypothetical protein
MQRTRVNPAETNLWERLASDLFKGFIKKSFYDLTIEQENVKKLINIEPTIDVLIEKEEEVEHFQYTIDKSNELLYVESLCGFVPSLPFICETAFYSSQKRQKHYGIVLPFRKMEFVLNVLNTNFDKFKNYDNMLFGMGFGEFSRKFLLYNAEKIAAEAAEGSTDAAIKGSIFLSTAYDINLMDRRFIRFVIDKVEEKYGKNIFPINCFIKNEDLNGEASNKFAAGEVTNELASNFLRNYVQMENIKKDLEANEGLSIMPFFKKSVFENSQTVNQIMNYLLLGQKQNQELAGEIVQA